MEKPTKLIFLEDQQLAQMQSTIVSVDEDEVGSFLVLDATIFYYGGGGQMPDQGWFEIEGSQWKIEKAKNVDGCVRHYVAQVEAQWVGKTADLFIEKDHRTMAAKLHTAGHLLSSIVYEKLQLPFKPISGFHFNPGAYVAFEPQQEEEVFFDLPLINAALKEAISESRIINTKIGLIDMEDPSVFSPTGFSPPKDKPLRLVTIEGYQSYLCGGTHVASTKEIGYMEATKVKKKKGVWRLSYSIA